MIPSPNESLMDTTMPVKQKPLPLLSSERNLENMRSNFYFGVILLMCIIATWLFARLYREAMITFDQNGTLTLMEYSWLFRLCLNLAGYSTVLLPGFLLYVYLKRINYFDRFPSGGVVSRCLHGMFAEPARLPEHSQPGEPARPRSDRPGSDRPGSDRPGSDLPELAFCFSGLMATYLLWGLLQEKIMTQVLSKSCKVIPVMVMGRLVSRNKYEPHEYVTAAAISAGMVLFMTGSRDDNSVSMISTWSGLCLLAVYMLCDSFTSSWQDRLFNKYSPALLPTHMVCGVSLWSCALSAAALAQQPALHHHAALLQSPMFVLDAALLCCSSSLGQLFIYRTIAKFGAVVFIVIMTCRQAASILVSCAVYGHRVSAGGVAGVLLVFTAVGARLYLRRRR